MKTVLVTGGTVRLGKAIADFLVERGWRVLVSSHRADSGADIVADLSFSSGAVKLYSAAMELLGGVPPDAIVNNAALLDGDPESVENVNFLSPSKLIMLMAGRETSRGFIVNILDGSLKDERFGAYNSSKEKLRQYSFRAAALFADTLNVNCVSPGPVLVPEGMGMRAGSCPLGKPDATDVAQAVAYLLEAKSVTGVDIPVDSGLRFF